MFSVFSWICISIIGLTVHVPCMTFFLLFLLFCFFCLCTTVLCTGYTRVTHVYLIQFDWPVAFNNAMSSIISTNDGDVFYPTVPEEEGVGYYNVFPNNCWCRSMYMNQWYHRWFRKGNKSFHRFRCCGWKSNFSHRYRRSRSAFQRNLGHTTSMSMHRWCHRCLLR